MLSMLFNKHRAKLFVWIHTQTDTGTDRFTRHIQADTDSDPYNRQTGDSRRHRGRELETSNLDLPLVK